MLQSKQVVWAATSPEDLTSPGGFSGRVLKDTVREKVMGCLVSLWTSFCWPVVEVARWYLENQGHQSSGSANLRSPCVWPTGS